AVPLPVTILNPRLSMPFTGFDLAPRPEMISASFGSATRQTSLNNTIRAMSAPTTPITTASTGMRPPVLRAGVGYIRVVPQTHETRRWFDLRDYWPKAGAT